MASKKPGWGGKRQGAGRPKAGDVIKIRKMLDEHIDPMIVVERLMDRIESGDHRAIELYLKYRAGLPKQEIDVSHSGEMNQTFSLKDVVQFKKKSK